MDFLAQLNYIEVAAAATALLCVWLYTRQNVWSWPITIVSATLYSIVFFQTWLYATMVLQGIYVILTIYGWYQWLHGGAQQSTLKVSRVTRTTVLVLAGIVVVGTGAVAYVLATSTNAALPFWDALTAVMSLVGQWMLAKKILENWLVWIVVDPIYVGIFIYQGHYLTALLYTNFLILAILGLLAWRKAMRAESATVSA